MRTPPRIGDMDSEAELPYPVETLRFWYVSPFGGRSQQLHVDEVGVNGDALARNTELEPDDRVSVALSGTDPERPLFFQEPFKVVALDPGHEAADLSPKGEVVLPDRAWDFVQRPHLQPRLGDAVVLKGTAAKRLDTQPEWLAELLGKFVRRPNF